MKTDMNKKQKNTRTFLIKNHGSAERYLAGRYLGGRAARAKHFRSALELLKLIDGALDNNYEVRIEE